MSIHLMKCIHLKFTPNKMECDIARLNINSHDVLGVVCCMYSSHVRLTECDDGEKKHCIVT